LQGEVMPNESSARERAKTICHEMVRDYEKPTQTNVRDELVNRYGGNPSISDIRKGIDEFWTEHFAFVAQHSHIEGYDPEILKAVQLLYKKAVEDVEKQLNSEKKKINDAREKFEAEKSTLKDQLSTALQDAEEKSIRHDEIKATLEQFRVDREKERLEASEKLEKAFDVQRQQSAEIRTLREQIKSVEIQASHMESLLNQTRIDSDKRIKDEKQRNEKAENELNIRIDKGNLEISSLNEKIESSNKQVSETQLAWDKQKQELQGQVEELKIKNTRLTSKLENEKTALSQEINRLQNKIDGLNSTNTALAEKNEILNADNQTLRGEFLELKGIQSANQNEIKTLTSLLANISSSPNKQNEFPSSTQKGLDSRK
jgi:chromosome segregation ATPase